MGFKDFISGEKYNIIVAVIFCTFFAVLAIIFRTKSNSIDKEWDAQAAKEISRYTVQVYTDGTDLFVKSGSADFGPKDIANAGLVKYASDGYYARLTSSCVRSYREAAEKADNYYFTDKGIKMVKVNVLSEEIPNFVALCSRVRSSENQVLPEGLLAKEVEEE